MELATVQPLVRVMKGHPSSPNGQRLGRPGYSMTSTLPSNLGTARSSIEDLRRAVPNPELSSEPTVLSLSPISSQLPLQGSIVLRRCLPPVVREPNSLPQLQRWHSRSKAPPLVEWRSIACLRAVLWRSGPDQGPDPRSPIQPRTPHLRNKGSGRGKVSFPFFGQRASGVSSGLGAITPT